MAKRTPRRKPAGRKPARPAATSRRRRPVRAAGAPARGKAAKPASRKTPKRNAPKKRAAARSRSAKPAKPAATPAKPAARRPRTAKPAKPAPHVAPARLARTRRTLDDIVPTPPSSLNLDRRGSAARTGRAETAEHRSDVANLTPAIAAGDVDVKVEDAYFSGDEAPGGDNPTPDQDVVEEIGKALGVEYQDAEELKGGDELTERDKHRWELDPASAEDYTDRD